MALRRGLNQLLPLARAPWGSSMAQPFGLAALSNSSVAWVHTAGQNRQQQQWAGAWAAGAAGAVAIGLASSSALADADASKEEPKQGAATDPYARPTVTTGLPSELVLYQYEVCPYCCKVKAFLDFCKLPYTVIEVNPLTKAELKWSDYKKVPLIKMDGEVVKDSNVIISRLEAEVEAAAPLQEQPRSKRSSWLFGSKSSSTSSSSAASSSDEETQWRRWVDERLVKTITANIYRNWDESWDTFRYITDQTNWSWGTRELARVSGAVLMWQIGQRMPKKYGLEGDLREALYADLREWLQALGSRRFMGGDKPNLADLAVFGVLRAVEKTPTFNDAVANTHIGGWYVRMSQAVGISSRL